MPNSELISYITEQTQEGVGAETLRETLMEQGWREYDIENAFHDVAAGMHPTTPGVSIHADLAQVRGMVSHLANRVKVLEARLVSAGALPMQKELPAPRQSPWVRRTAGLLFGVVLFVVLHAMAMGLIARKTFMPADLATIGLSLASLLLVGGYVFLRLRRAWAASMLTDASIGLFALVSWQAYRSYQYMEPLTAVATAILLLVLWMVMERWTGRLTS